MNRSALGFDEEPVLTHRSHVERGAPAVVDKRLHGDRGPLQIVVVTIADVAGEHVVPVGEHIRLHDHGVPDGGLGGTPPAVNLGTDRLDHRPHLVRGDLRGAHHVHLDLGVPLLRLFRGFCIGAASSSSACRHTSDTTSLVRVLPDRHRPQTGPTGDWPPEWARRTGTRWGRSARPRGSCAPLPSYRRHPDRAVHCGLLPAF